MDTPWPPEPPPMDEEEAAKEDDGLRLIQGSAADWHRGSADEACRYLAELPELFLDRSREMMWVDDAPSAAPSIRYVVPATVPDLLGRADVACQHLVKRGEAFQWAFLQPPPVLCQTVVSRRPRTVRWRCFEGFASGPYLLPDGNVIAEHGFHAARGLWLPHIGVADLRSTGKGALKTSGFPEVSTGKGALDWVAKELSEFPWADKDLDLAVWLAYLLTLVTRPSYDHAPLFLFEASRPRSGKDLLFKCAEVIAHGRSAHRITLAENPEENEKRIGTGLLAGHTTLIFGDVKHLGSPLLLSLITEGHNVVVRMLGTNTAIPVPRTLTLGANANNVTFNVPDLVPRTIALRLDPPTDSPETAPHAKDQSELLAHFAQHRSSMLAAVFNALRGFLRRKRDPETEPRGIPCGSFPEWGRLVRDCLLYYGFADVLESQARLKKQVPVGEQGALDALYSAWFALVGKTEITSGRLLQMASQTEQTQERADGNGYENVADPKRQALADAIGGLFDQKPSPRKLTAKLREQRDRIITIEDRRLKLKQRTVHGQEAFALEPIE